MIFNIIGVVVVVGCLPLVARFLEKLVPATEADRQRLERQMQKHQSNAEQQKATSTAR